MFRNDMWKYSHKHLLCFDLMYLPRLPSDFPFHSEEVRHDQLVGGDCSVRLQQHQSRVGGAGWVTYNVNAKTFFDLLLANNNVYNGLDQKLNNTITDQCTIF